MLNSLIRSLCLGAILAFAAQVYAAPPNIIYIMADDLGYGDLGCYGQKDIQTPHLDRMAAQGLRFTQCYAGSTVCAPSRSCLMTGQHTGHTWVRGNKRVPLRPKDVTVAEVLQQAGYTTGIIGKWGLGEPDTTGIPNRQGFDVWFGYLNQRHAHNYYPDYLWRNEQKVPLEGNVVHMNVATKRTHYSHDLFAEEALTFLDTHKDERFFLYLALTIPHANNEAGVFGMEVPDDAPYSRKPWPEAQRNHAAMITRMDRDIGRLLERLRTLGIDRDTIVFFTSDNGPHAEGGGHPKFFNSSGPLRGYKRDLYEGGIRVPMIVRWPGTIEAGRVSDQPWAFWDFLPTASELAGAETPHDIDGISILPTLLDKGTQKQHDYFYWEFHEGGCRQAVRLDDYKAVRHNPDRAIELYDLSRDLGETTDIAAKHPEIIERAARIMTDAHTPSEHWPVKALDG